MQNEKIDVVILWVDGNDEEWLKEKEKYAAAAGQDGGRNRYRDWGTLKYLFRGLEKFAPWVNRVFFVTCGHYPEWLNLECPKLRLIKHEDFIPADCLPTFSSSAIDMNLHRIEELSEKYIYFNDDMFLTDYVTPEDFFKKDLPRDWFVETPIFPRTGIFSHNMINILQVIQKHFKRGDYLKKHFKKIINPHYGKMMIYNLLWYLFPYQETCGLYLNHLPMAYRKSTLHEVWQAEPEIMDATIHNRFRTITDVNQFIFNYWALYKGEFYPTNMKKQGRFFVVVDENQEELCKAIRSRKYKRLCINDDCSEAVFEAVKQQLMDSFEQILPEKCEFER